jgi:hypothetical protein
MHQTKINPSLLPVTMYSERQYQLPLTTHQTTNKPRLFICTRQLAPFEKQRSCLETFKQSNALSEIGEHCLEKNSQIVSLKQARAQTVN